MKVSVGIFLFCFFLCFAQVQAQTNRCQDIFKSKVHVLNEDFSSRLKDIAKKYDGKFRVNTVPVSLVMDELSRIQTFSITFRNGMQVYASYNIKKTVVFGDLVYARIAVGVDNNINADHGGYYHLRASEVFQREFDIRKKQDPLDFEIVDHQSVRPTIAKVNTYFLGTEEVFRFVERLSFYLSGKDLDQAYYLRFNLE